MISNINDKFLENDNLFTILFLIILVATCIIKYFMQKISYKLDNIDIFMYNNTEITNNMYVNGIVLQIVTEILLTMYYYHVYRQLFFYTLPNLNQFLLSMITSIITDVIASYIQLHKQYFILTRKIFNNNNCNHYCNRCCQCKHGPSIDKAEKRNKYSNNLKNIKHSIKYLNRSIGSEFDFDMKKDNLFKEWQNRKLILFNIRYIANIFNAISFAILAYCMGKYRFGNGFSANRGMIFMAISAIADIIVYLMICILYYVAQGVNVIVSFKKYYKIVGGTLLIVVTVLTVLESYFIEDI